MAHKMRKFSEGGALGKYNRRMADIEKDYKIALAKGKNADVAAAKRDQRKADAEDDRAKRTGADRTATRAAERLAESNLTKTRKYGAPKAVTTEVPVAKITETLSVPKMDSSIGAKPAATKPKAPVKTTKAPARTPKADTPKADTPKADAPKADYRKINFGKPATTETAPQAAARVKEARAESGPSTKRGLNPNSIAGMIASGKLFGTSDAFRKSQEAKYGKAKGGKIMKYAKGGSTPPQPTPADRARSKAQMESLKKVKPTPAEIRALQSANRSEGRRYAAGGVTKEMPSSKAMGSLNMAKGGKAKAKAKGKSFAATKFGAAMMKKSADTKGRAMPKFAKGGSIDGCAVRGKTKAKRVTMKSGGSC
jgi:hypothetical protein